MKPPSSRCSTARWRRADLCHLVSPALKLPPIVRQLPNVLVDCYVEDRSLPSVVPDEFQGGYTATELLLRQGHRRIGFINNNEDQPACGTPARL